MCCLFPAFLRVRAECINNGHLEKPSGRKEKKQTQSKRLKQSWGQKEKLSLGAACSDLFSPSLAPTSGFLPSLASNIPGSTEEAPVSLAIRAGTLIQTA